MKIKILILLLILITPTILAEEGCCLLTNVNKPCAYIEEFDCSSSDFAPGSDCTTTTFCEPGCCYNTETGIYGDNTFKSACSSQWSSSPCDNIDGSQKGCCVLGESALPSITEKQCELQSTTQGYELDWQEISNAECQGLITSQEKGACVTESGDCTLTIGENCETSLSTFHPGHLCSSEPVGSTCGMPEENPETICGEDGRVYFLDSCGQKANVYDSSRARDQSYWNEILVPETLCSNPTDSATCGNCKFQESTCSPAIEDNFEVDMGDNYCKDTSCDFEGENYKDKESWCVYDGKVGNGTDTVGSLHWLRYCDRGEVITDSCKDYRAEICIQSNTDDDGNIFRNAECVRNDWESCFDITEKSECEDNPFCDLKEVSIDNFKLTACLPEYPKGFDFSLDNPSQRKKNEELCEAGSAECKVTYVKEISGLKTKWVCKSNCECRTSEFNDKMNDICISLGDCGGYINYQGVYTNNGFSISGETWDLNLSEDKILKYLDNLDPIIDFFIKEVVLEDYSQLLGSMGTNSGTYQTSRGKETLKIVDSFKKRLLEGHVAEIGGYWLYHKIAGVGKSKENTVTFTCKPWAPPTENFDCESCNDPLKPCTPYRCSSIGTTCEIINKGTLEEMCYNTGKEDNKAPIITLQQNTISEGFKFDTSSSPTKITPMEGGCVDPLQDITFGINTNEPAWCKFDIEEKTFNNLSWDFGSSSYTYNHTTTQFIPHVGHINIANPDVNWNGELNFHIICKDTKGHQTSGFYNIEMCVNDAPDTASLGIKTFSPESNSLISFDATSQDIIFRTVEISTCHWSLNDVEYSAMENNATCTNLLCNATLPTPDPENTFYFRCMDQPWLEELGSGNERNADTSSKPYTLKKPSKRITIDSIKPNEDIISATNKQVVNIEVKTSGGGSSHKCSYKWREGASFIEMYKTRKTGTHEQPGINMEAGEIKIEIKCIDQETDDETTNSTEFRINKSNIDLEITPIEDFTIGTSLNTVDLFLTTSGGGELHTCSYQVGNAEKIEFDKIETRGTQSQEIEVGTGKITIQIECHDEFQNTASGKISFEITHDESAPTVSRIWQSSGNLYIITAGEDECKYSTKDCNFNWDEGKSAGSGQRHTIDATKGETYYIKCADKFGNTPQGCSVVAQAL